MDEKIIVKLKKLFDDIIHTSEDGEMEFWYARELQPLLGYSRWENFELVIKKAIIACENAGGNVGDHFRGVTKMVSIGSGAARNIYERGVDDAGFGRIRAKGDQALFGGFTTKDMKVRLGVKENRPLADFLPTLTIAAKNLATKMTNYNVEQKDLYGETPITEEHVQNNSSVREMLGKRGIKPETLPPAED